MPKPPKTAHTPTNARLELRVSRAQKDFFQHAAALAGRTLSEFVIESTQEAAATIIHAQEQTRLSQDEQIAFVIALLNPPNPGSRLRRAVENYRQKLAV